jgi:glycosyltransferase involved in cell wall biosynthesis
MRLVSLSVERSSPERKSDQTVSIAKSDFLEGVNLVGYLAAENGLGEAARSIRRAAEATGINVVPMDFRWGCASRMAEPVPSRPMPSKPYMVNLIHLNADQLLTAHTILGADFFKGHYNIAYSVWEQEEFPEDWVPALDLVHEIWTASTFCLDVISRKTARSVIRIPHSIEPVVPAALDRRSLGLPETGFIFLAIADFFSTPERKNHFGALQAYAMAKERIPQETYFVLKTANSAMRPEVMQDIEQLQISCPSIIVRDGYIGRSEVNALINACDCFVSLHRAEGFGLPIAEAMYMRKPVIATGWSGNMDFMNPNNSFPVRFELQPLDHEVGPYRKGFRWAEPDLHHAAELMELVTRDPERARKMGETAGRDLKQGFSLIAVGRLIRERLEKIHSELIVKGDGEIS